MTQRVKPGLRGRLSTARITRRVDLTEDLFKIWIEPEGPFSFKPGQYCTIGVDGIERPYSIASAPSEPAVELFIEHIPPPIGELTPLLYRLGVGHDVSIRPRAKGLFLFNPDYKNHVMVATVTGVTPYISMLRAHLETSSPGHRFFILEGASYMDEFGYDEELRELEERHEAISFFPAVSRPDEERNRGWKGARGRINTLVLDYLRDVQLPPENTLVYACGHPGMIEDVRGKLENSGYGFSEERFWKDEDE